MTNACDEKTAKRNKSSATVVGPDATLAAEAPSVRRWTSPDVDNATIERVPDLMSTTKAVSFRGQSFEVEGLSADDRYFKTIGDGFEPDFEAICEKFIAPDYVCLDIGANIGMKSLLLSRFVPRGRVVAVEAGPGVAAVLKRNVASCDNIRAIHGAVSDVDGEVGFNEVSAFGHINAGGVPVPSRTIATIVAESGGRLDFIKIDVEGHEFTILRNALGEINAQRALVLFEFNSWCLMAHSGVLPLDFAKWVLANFAYCFVVRGGGRCERIVDPHTLAHDNITRDGSVTDVLVTNAPERLVALLDDALEQRRAPDPAAQALAREHERLLEAVSRQDQALARLGAQIETQAAQIEAQAVQIETQAARIDSLGADRDLARREIAIMKASRSWRWTAPLRR